MDQLIHLFPGIGSFFVDHPTVSATRLGLIVFGMVLAYYGSKRTLEPLIMVPMGVGMVAINCGVLFLESGFLGNIIVNPMVSDPAELVNIMQINFLQPIYNLTFSNGLVACLVFMGIGGLSDISFLLVRPWACIIIAIFAELGTFATLVIALSFGLPAGEAAAIATIGGADGPMVLFTSLILARELFVPISIIAYLYLSLTYVGYPYIIKLLIPARYRSIETDFTLPEVPQRKKVVFILVITTVLCLLLPVAAPLIMSFFLGMLIREAAIEPLHDLLTGPILYGSTFFLGLMLGTLCEARTILDPKVGILLVLGIVALAISAVGAIFGGWLIYYVSKRTFNPVIGIAGVSCMPTTAKIAQKIAMEQNPYCMIMPLAMGASISGIIVSAIAAGVFISTLGLLSP
jgi:carboxybiotin decarboxylase